jgi:hypothetical protein
MPRPLRRCPAGIAYHVLNRAVGPRRIFFKDADYAAFQRILAEAIDRAHAPAEGPATAPGAMGLKNIPDPFEYPKK